LLNSKTNCPNYSLLQRDYSLLPDVSSATAVTIATTATTAAGVGQNALDVDRDVRLFNRVSLDFPGRSGGSEDSAVAVSYAVIASLQLARQPSADARVILTVRALSS
jgi:hypothetical protein